MNFFCGADEGTPVVVTFRIGEVFGEENLDKACRLRRVVLRVKAGACGVEARGKDAGVVEDEEVAGREKLWQISEEMVGEDAGAA